MKTQNSMADIASYVGQLSLADVDIIDDERHKITFNGANSINEFESRLFEIEASCLAFFWGLRQEINNSFILKEFVKQEIVWVEELFLEDEQLGMTHTHSYVHRNGEAVALSDLTPETCALVAAYVDVQQNSLARSRLSLLNTKKAVAPEIQIRMTSAELLEIVLALEVSGRFSYPRGKVTTVACVRHIATALNLKFPANYYNQLYCLTDRNKVTIFLDALRENYIRYLYEKKDRKDLNVGKLINS